MNKRSSVDDFIYDIETYPNIFTCIIKQVSTDNRWVFEISDRKNDIESFMQMMYYLQSLPGARMVGYNNVGFDYPILHKICVHYGQFPITVQWIYEQSQVFFTGTQQQRWDMNVWPDKRWVEQMDLFLMHHFNNKARSTSLKMLEFQMHADSIQDLPFPPGTVLTPEQMNWLIYYNHHDVDETERFYHESKKLIAAREELTRKFGRNCMNDNDAKIGTEYMIEHLEKKIPGICYDYSSGRKVKRQTMREYVALKDVILPYIQFMEPEFDRIKTWMEQQVLTRPQFEVIDGLILQDQHVETKGVFKDVHCQIGGFTYHFGLGGIHGSIDSATVKSDDDWAIVDIDVASYYPNLAIANRFYPEHLSEEFCNIYEDIYHQRKQHAKGTAENAMFKLALNATYGNSNNKYSPLYDPQYTMSITINGQLLLCVLAEHVMSIPGCKMIQINTDGLTVKLPRKFIHKLDAVCRWWEIYTGLVLEDVEYDTMYIRDVNNYIAMGVDGKVKRKGAYENAHPRDRNPLGWHQNTSMLVVQKVASDALVHDWSREQITLAVMNHEDDYDFMLRTKVPRGSRLYIGDTQVQNITRYAITTNGQPLKKVMPPTPTQVKNDANAPDREFAINKTWLVADCNEMSNFRRKDVNYAFYIEEVHKLVDPIRGRVV